MTNFQLHKHPTIDAMPGGPLTPETNAFWRYRTLVERIARHVGPFTPDDLKASSACVNIRSLLDTIGSDAAGRSVAAGIQSRTLWHSLYDQHARTADFSFYLGEDLQPDGTRTERRSEYLRFILDAKAADAGPTLRKHAGDS